MDTVLNTTNLPSGTAWMGLESWWWTGREVVTFTHWRSQLPCAALNAAGFWEERDCSEENYFICESQGGTQQYRLIEENKTFAAAQRHCRESCSDLLRVDSVGESEQIKTMAQGHAVWVALLQDGWEWSDRGCSGFRNWSPGEPSGGGAQCTEMFLKDGVQNSKKRGWEERDCEERNYFMCLNKTERSNVILIELNQTWTEAQSLCRQKHTELVSVRRQSENEKVWRSARGHRMWIGLYNEPWKWSDQGVSTFRNWAGGQPGSAGGQRCTQVDLQDSLRGRWTETNCSEIRPFFCHWDTRELILVREKKSWAEALDHCQTHHTGLVDIQSHKEQSYAAEEAQSVESTLVWLGLRQNQVSGSWFWANEAPLINQN
ncbi:MRC2 protein, partial [Atractosteus spatula]|nr:MRC2 protein [Atractosteus spatula]